MVARHAVVSGTHEQGCRCGIDQNVIQRQGNIDVIFSRDGSPAETLTEEDGWMLSLAHDGLCMLSANSVHNSLGLSTGLRELAPAYDLLVVFVKRPTAAG